MAVWGMDISQVRELAQLLGQKAQEIDTILSTITNKLSSTQWEGPDQKKFTSDWQGQHSAALRQVAEALRETQRIATQNAQDQENASNT